MIRLAKEDAAKQTESIQKKAEEDVANYQERMVSSIDLQKRTKDPGCKAGSDRRSAGESIRKGKSHE